MEIQTHWGDEARTNFIVSIAGNIDTSTADDLAASLTKAIQHEPAVLTLDFADVCYVTSAGLRVLLAAQKKTNALKRRMRLCNVNDSIQNVFAMTGFTDILEIAGKGVKLDETI